MSTKINLISQLVPRNARLFSSWLTEGIDRKERIMYERGGWLERFAHGVISS